MNVVTRVAVIIFACCSCSTDLRGNDTRTWNVGVARRVITPDTPMWMGGYASRTGPGEQKLSDLYAKCLTIEDRAGTRLVILTMDLIGVPRRIRESVARRASKQYGLPSASLIINASHTHCGPELRVESAIAFGIDKKWIETIEAYVTQLESTLVELIGESLERLEPAQLHFAQARAGFAMNRRRPTINGVINSPNPDGPVDHEVPVLSIVTPEGQLRAVLMGYACHNTTMAFDRFYGDYAGCAQQYLEEAHPGSTALFLTGCGGDQNPYPRRKVELAEQHGRALANAVETALQVVDPRTIHGPLLVDTAEVSLPYATTPSRMELLGLQQSEDEYERRRATWLLERLERGEEIRDSYIYPLQVAQFGRDLTLVTLAGEPVVEYSLRLKAELAGKSVVWVAGYCHDGFGYLPTRQMLLEGGYEGGSSVRYSLLPDSFDLTVEKKVLSTACELVRSLRRSE